jgi:competence protein ComEA
MDRSASPWRVLDDAATPGTGSAPPATDVGRSGDVAGASATSRSSPRLVGGLIAACVLAAAAFAVAATGSSNGAVTVDSAGAPIGGSSRPSSASDGTAGEARSVGGSGLVVDVQGAVVRPGIHRLDIGSRVADAIAAAGGYGPRVDAERAGRELNLAAQLKDGDRVFVPSRDDPSGPGGAASMAPGGGGSTSGGTGGGLVDLNHATASELDALPGIGPVTAQKIISAREEQLFSTIEALRDRKVVGGAAFEKLKDLVTVRP